MEAMTHTLEGVHMNQESNDSVPQLPQVSHGTLKASHQQHSFAQSVGLACVERKRLGTSTSEYCPLSPVSLIQKSLVNGP